MPSINHNIKKMLVIGALLMTLSSFTTAPDIVKIDDLGCWDMSWSFDSKVFVCVSQGGITQVNPTDGRNKKINSTDIGHVMDVEFHPQKNVLAITTRDKFIYLYELSNGNILPLNIALLLPYPCDYHGDCQISWSTDGKKILINYSIDNQKSKNALLLDVSERQIYLEAELLAEHYVWSPDGKYIASIDTLDGEVVTLWDAQNRVIINQYNISESVNYEIGGIKWISFNPDGSKLGVVVNSLRNTVKDSILIIDPGSGKLLHEIPFDAGALVSAAQWTADNKIIVNQEMWDAQNNYQELQYDTASIIPFALEIKSSPDGKITAFSVYNDGIVLIPNSDWGENSFRAENEFIALIIAVFLLILAALAFRWWKKKKMIEEVAVRYPEEQRKIIYSDFLANTEELVKLGSERSAAEHGATLVVLARYKMLPAHLVTILEEGRKKEWKKTGAAGKDSGGGRTTGDYSFVKDFQTGEVHGIWLRDASKADNEDYLVALLLKHGHTPMGIARGLRVVPNTFDQSGGCFVMFGSDKAPGE